MTLEGNMAHPGMAPVFAAAIPVGVGGQYRGQIVLNMPGDWIISAKAKTQDGSIIEQQFPATVSEK